MGILQQKVEAAETFSLVSFIVSGSRNHVVGLTPWVKGELNSFFTVVPEHNNAWSQNIFSILAVGLNFISVGVLMPIYSNVFHKKHLLSTTPICFYLLTGQEEPWFFCNEKRIPVMQLISELNRNWIMSSCSNTF